MRVAFNGLFLQEPNTGTGRYTYNLLQSLGRVDGVNEYHVLSPYAPREVPDTPSTFHWETVPIGRLGISENVEKVVWEQRTFPQAAKRTDAQVMHIPYFAPPLRAAGIPTIVTVHDVINLRLPVYRASTSAQLYGRLVQRAIRGTTLVITVSEYSKSDIVELLGISDDRVRVVREAPAAQYRRVTDAEKLRTVAAKYGVGERFVLNVGGMDARKNIQGLIGAFAAVYHELRDPNLRLFIAGDPQRLGRAHSSPIGVRSPRPSASPIAYSVPPLTKSTSPHSTAALRASPSPHSTRALASRRLRRSPVGRRWFALTAPRCRRWSAVRACW